MSNKKDDKDKPKQKKRPVGRPSLLKDRITANVILDKKTDKILKKVDSNRSNAIRIVADQYEQDYLINKKD